jgi:hypothetical protein
MKTQALVELNKDKLPADVADRIASGLKNKTIAPLSADKEPSLFILYCAGNTLEQVALKTSVPLDLVYLTSITYDWEKKRKLVGMSNAEDAALLLNRDFVNTLLAATYASMSRKLGEVLAGKAGPESVPLIPRKMSDVEKLVNIVLEVNKQVAEKEAAAAKTVIHATNVQINQGIKEETDEEKMSLLKELEDI